MAEESRRNRITLTQTDDSDAAGSSGSSLVFQTQTDHLEADWCSRRSWIIWKQPGVPDAAGSSGSRLVFQTQPDYLEVAW